MKLNLKKLAFYIIVPIALGAFVGLISGSFKGFDTVNMPSFAPPKIVFPIVWSFLYILMGVSRYIISQKVDNTRAIKIYNLQLIVNLLWSFFFFSFKWYLFSFGWIILLIGLVLLMILNFYRLSKVSAYIQVPYLLWISFAAILNLAIYILN